MGIKTTLLCVAAVLVLGGGGYGLHHYLASEAKGSGYRDFSESTFAAEDIEKAMAAYQGNQAKAATVLKPVRTDDKVVYLYFCGLPDRPLTEKIVDLLEKEKGTAAFFVEGQNAMDEEETMKLIHKKGHQLGNYTWLGRPEFEKVKEDNAIASMVKTQKALSLMGGDAPLYFKAPQTKYTDDLLKEMGAAGLRYAVESSVTVKRGQLKSASDAEELVKTVKNGDLIAFEINRPLNIKVYEKGKSDEKPAIDKKPTVKDDHKTEAVTKDTTAEQIQWLIEALDEAGFTLRDLKYVKSGVGD